MTDRPIPVEPMWIFRLRLSWALIVTGAYVPWWQAWSYSGEDCWLDYWRDGYTGNEALDEDLSHD